MDESLVIYDSILRNDTRAARDALEQAVKKHGLKQVPALSAEHALALFEVIVRSGQSQFITRLIRFMACQQNATFWHRLFYYSVLRDSLGFLVTLELLEQLESQVLGSPRHPAPLRDLVINPAASSGDSLVSRRERHVLSELTSRNVEIDAEDEPLYGFAFTCMRAELHASGYWQRTAREHLEHGTEEASRLWPELAKRPMLASFLLHKLLSGYVYLRDWTACDNLLQRLRELPGSEEDVVIWEVLLADCQSDFDQADRLLKAAEPRCHESLRYWHRRISADLKRENFADACQGFERAMAMAGRKQHRYYGGLGMCHYRQGRHDEAVRLWRESGNKSWIKMADFLHQRIDSGELADRTSIDLPSIIQKPNHCGPCSLSMIARFWGVELSQETIGEALSQWGTHLYKLATFAEQHNLTARFGSRDFDAVADAVRAGFPVLLSFSYPGGGHFVVATGHDPNLDRLEIRDPNSTFTYLLSRKGYQRESSYTDYLTAVVCPPDRTDSVPALPHSEALYRDLAKSQTDRRSSQMVCEELRANHAEQDLATFNSYADLQLYSLLDDHQLPAARELAADILERNDDSLFACSRVAQAFLYADSVQDAYETVCRAETAANGQPAAETDTLSDLLRQGRNLSHEYVEFMRARCAERLGNLQVAAVSLTRSINRYPVEGSKFMALADLMERLGEEEEQLKFLDIAQQISGPNVQAATAELAILRRKEDYSAALELIDRTMEEFSDRHWLWGTKGELLEEMHHYDEALACYRRVNEELPQWHRGYTSLLSVFNRTGNLAAAQELLDQLDDKMGENVDRWCVRAYWHILQRDWPKVVEAADRCLAESPHYGWACYFKAQALEATARLEEAAAVWQEVVQEVDPSDYYWDLAVASLGRLGRKMEDTSAFESAFQHAIEVAPDSPSLWNAMCDRFRFSGRVEEALQYFEALYQRVTDKAGLALAVGGLLMELRAIAEARTWFERVSPQNAAFPDAVRGIIDSLSAENRIEDAMEMLHRLAEDAPSPEIYSMLVRIHLEAYQPGAAAQWLRRSLSEYPGRLPDAANEVFHALDHAGEADQLQSLVEFLVQCRDDLVGRPRSEITVCIAEAYQVMERLDEALQACEEVLASEPNSGLAWITKAEVQFDRGEFDAAIDSARRSCATRYGSYPFRRLFGFLCDMGRIDEAFDVCTEGLELFPGELGFQELLDRLVLQFQMLDRYLEACERLFPLVEDKASFLGNQGTVFLRLGELDRAGELFEQALQYGDYNWLHAQQGVVLREQGDFLGAETEFLAALRVNPHYNYALERLIALYEDWFFSYDQVAEHLGQDTELPSQEELWEKIHSFYAHIAETQPNADDFFKDYCRFCVRCGDLAPAEQLAQHYAEASAVYSIIGCHLAEAYTNLHDIDRAYRHLQKAVDTDEPEPFKVKAYLQMGWHVETFMHDPNEALAWYRRAVAADPEELGGYQAVADILEEQGRLEETLREVLAGLDQVEDPLPLLRPLANTAVQAEQWPQIQQAIRDCLDRLPARAVALGWMNVARGLAEAYDYEGAHAALELSQATCELPVELEESRMTILRRQSEDDRVEECARRLVDLDPDNIQGLYELSHQALRRSDIPSALQYMELMIKAGGEPPGHLTKFAYAAAENECMPQLLQFCDACYTEGHVRGTIHLLQIAAHHMLGDQAAVGSLMENLAEVDASLLPDAEIMLGKDLVSRTRFDEAAAHFQRAIAIDPQNTYARCQFAGTMFALGNGEAARPHMPYILRDQSRDYWALRALSDIPEAAFSDLRPERERFQAYFDIFLAAAGKVSDARTAKSILLDVARRWNLYPQAVDYARELLDDSPKPNELIDMFEAAIFVPDLDLADRIVATGKTLHVHPVTIAQLKSICHSLRGEIDQAIASAYESRHGHGSLFAEMCIQLFKTGADVGDLCDTLYDCMTRYHEGHGTCSTWALLLLLRHGRMPQFETGMASITASARDYRLSHDQRRALVAAATAVQLYQAQQANDTEQQAAILQQIATMPFFNCDIGNELYDLLGLNKKQS